MFFICLLISFLGFNQSQIEQKLIGNWEFNPKEDNLVKTNNHRKNRFYIEFLEKGRCLYPYIAGICGNEKPRMREGKWELKDSILKIQLMQFAKEKIVSFRIQEISEKYLILN